VNDDLEIIWKEAFAALCEVLSRHLRGGTQENSEYNWEVFLFELTFPVNSVDDECGLLRCNDCTLVDRYQPLLKAAGYIETSVLIYQTARHDVLEGSDPFLHRRENIKSHFCWRFTKLQNTYAYLFNSGTWSDNSSSEQKPSLLLHTLLVPLTLYLGSSSSRPLKTGSRVRVLASYIDDDRLDCLFFVSWSAAVRLSPLVTSDTIWPIVPASDDGWWWVWSGRWNDWQGKPKYSEETCLSATLSTTNPTWRDPDRRGGKPATNRLSYGSNVTVLDLVSLEIRSMMTEA
jgi:hypothetical protein